MTRRVRFGRRLLRTSWVRRSGWVGEGLLAITVSLSSLVLGRAYLIEVTSQFLATAALQILLPRKPFPPHTTIFRLADADAAVEAIVADVV